MSSPLASQETLTIEGRLEAVSISDRGDATLLVNRRRLGASADAPVMFPGRRVTVRALAAEAPARCRIRKETGLLPTDRCLGTGNGPHVRVSVEAARVGDALVATSLTIHGTGERVSGAVTFLASEDGYMRIGGEYGADRGGTLVRINDPHGAFSVQQGRACGDEGNCSPDARFAADVTEPAVRFENGPPACIPSIGMWSFCAGSQGDGAMRAIRKGDHLQAHGITHTMAGEPVFVAHAVVVSPRPASR
jgi:hypothetical protein